MTEQAHGLRRQSGFWSYTHFDNEHDEEQIARLCRRIQGEVRALGGIDFELFIDKTELHVGDEWQKRIDQALEISDILIPVITPSYFSSSSCRHEYELFVNRELSSGRRDLIAPIYYISCPELEYTSEHRSNDGWTIGLRQRQYADFRFLRTSSRTSAQAARAIERFARDILLASLRRSASSQEPVTSAPTRQLPTAQVSVSANHGTPDEEQVIETYSNFPETQKNIVAFLYTLHKPGISVDDLYTAICKKFSNDAVGSATELHYRLQVLGFQGFVKLHVMGRRTTVVNTIPAIAKILSDHNIIFS